MKRKRFTDTLSRIPTSWVGRAIRVFGFLIRPISSWWPQGYQGHAEGEFQVKVRLLAEGNWAKYLEMGRYHQPLYTCC